MPRRSNRSFFRNHSSVLSGHGYHTYAFPDRFLESLGHERLVIRKMSQTYIPFETLLLVRNSSKKTHFWLLWSTKKLIVITSLNWQTSSNWERPKSEKIFFPTSPLHIVCAMPAIKTFVYLYVNKNHYIWVHYACIGWCVKQCLQQYRE